ncbi:MAG: hypothetical protein P0S95_04185 [Rhabdochlamydiaceae bacterium]|nr:hypothetical protein [Candidatus Amphrikana amoebophyrae]
MSESVNSLSVRGFFDAENVGPSQDSEIPKLPCRDYFGAIGSIFSTQDGPFRTMLGVLTQVEFWSPNLKELALSSKKELQVAAKLFTMPLFIYDVSSVVSSGIAFYNKFYSTRVFSANPDRSDFSISVNFCRALLLSSKRAILALLILRSYTNKFTCMDVLSKRSWGLMQSSLGLGASVFALIKLYNRYQYRIAQSDRFEATDASIIGVGTVPISIFNKIKYEREVYKEQLSIIKTVASIVQSSLSLLSIIYSAPLYIHIVCKLVATSSTVLSLVNKYFIAQIKNHISENMNNA